jgi:hypothetical protein
MLVTEKASPIAHVRFTRFIEITPQYLRELADRLDNAVKTADKKELLIVPITDGISVVYQPPVAESQLDLRPPWKGSIGVQEMMEQPDSTANKEFLEANQ